MYKIFINKYLQYFQIQESLSYSENIPNYFQSFQIIYMANAELIDLYYIFWSD